VESGKRAVREIIAYRGTIRGNYRIEL